MQNSIRDDERSCYHPNSPMPHDKGLTEYHHTPDAITGAPVAALPQNGSVRGSGTMFIRPCAPRSHLAGALCAASDGLLFPSQPVTEYEHSTLIRTCQPSQCTNYGV